MSPEPPERGAVAAPADLNWTSVLEHHAARTPDRPMAVSAARSATYAEALDRSLRVAGGLSARGVGRGDVVGLLSYNSVEMLETIFAANALGAIAMPINWRLAAPEIRYLLEHSGAGALVCDAELLDLGGDAAAGLDLLRICVPVPGIDGAGGDGWATFEELAAAEPAPRAEAAGSDVHRLMYTSGTTGRPKGVMLTHANLAWKNAAHVAELGFTAADVGLACGPLYHVGALDLITTSLISVGATTVVHRTFDAAAVVDEIERSRVTCVWMAPAMLRAVLDEPDVERRDLSSVRLIIAGGEKLPIPFIDRLERTFPSAWLADAYGLTETVSGDTFLDPASTRSKLGSVGRPCPYLDLQVWDAEGRPVPPGERGEVVLRGPKVFAGYWRDPDATARAFEGGWFHTGDIGVVDADGYVYIVDRLKDMIISGGENIAGSEVERVLDEHPAVLEVAVVGRPHERWGEVPVAYVVARPGSAPTADELIEHCRGQLARFKVPADVEFLEALPRNPSGKVLKRELREER
ncbi:acyl-CoA synthetase [Dermatobacter hominis]|uniref:acyl-CoA synthetase n=1 Tax=Dermatobacter hominis TaxID=2884263 RepID=UPI001D1091A3|nr:long-chain fatty acid--CoA ligase [Dermatobacter hominis]